MIEHARRDRSPHPVHGAPVYSFRDAPDGASNDLESEQDGTWQSHAEAFMKASQRPGVNTTVESLDPLEHVTQIRALGTAAGIGMREGVRTRTVVEGPNMYFMPPATEIEAAIANAAIRTSMDVMMGIADPAS